MKKRKRPQVTLNRVTKEGKRTDKLELHFFRNGLVVHRHGFVEDTEENRVLFPVRWVVRDKLYYKQELLLCPDEVTNLFKLLYDRKAEHLMQNYFRQNWFTRFLWKVILKITIKWQYEE